MKSVWDTVNKCSVCCRTKQKIHAKKKKEEKAEKNPFYLNGEGNDKGAVWFRKRHSLVLRGLGGLPERNSIEQNFDQAWDDNKQRRPEKDNPGLGNGTSRWFSGFSTCQNHLEDFWKHRQLGPTQRSWFSSSGVRPENLHFQQFPANADVSGLGTTLWDPLAGPGNCISPESHSLT